MVQLVGVPLMNKVRTFRLPPRPLSACLYDKTPPRKNVVGYVLQSSSADRAESLGL